MERGQNEDRDSVTPAVLYHTAACMAWHASHMPGMYWLSHGCTSMPQPCSQHACLKGKGLVTSLARA